MKRISVTNYPIGMRHGADWVSSTWARVPIYAVLALGFMVILVLSSGSLAQSVMVGACTPGQHECQADKVMACACFEEWRDIDGRETMVVVCEWEWSGESCETPVHPPACTEAYEGATFEFPDEVKKCRCDSDGDCSWF